MLKMLEDYIALVLLEYKNDINYNGRLTLSDIEKIIADPNYPTPDINKRIIDIAFNIQRNNAVAIALDNSDFRAKLSDNHQGVKSIQVTEELINSLNGNSLESTIIREYFGILSDNPREIIRSIIRRGLYVHYAYNSIPIERRWIYGILYAYLAGVNFIKYNVIDYNDAKLFGEAYFVYSYIGLVSRSTFVQMYEQSSLHVKYIILKLLKYDKIIDIDILRDHSIQTFFSEQLLIYNKLKLDNKRFYYKLSSDIILAIAKTFDDYTAVLMPRILYEKTIPPIAHYLARLPNETQKVIDELGIVPPKDYDPYEYVLTNSKSYNYMLEVREEYSSLALLFPAMSDREILDNYGYVTYLSRDDLTSEMFSLDKYEGFFVPTKNKSCINEVTAYEESVEMETVLAYGTLHDYHCYSNEELLNSLESENGVVILQLWHSKERISDKEQLLELKNLLTPFKEFNSFIEKLDYMLRSSVDIEKHVLHQFQLMTNTEKEQIKELLLQLFIIGMYMLRWTGNGPYPVDKKQTEINIDPEPKTIQALVEYATMLDNSTQNVQNFVSNLNVYDTPSSKGTKVIKQIIEIVSKGNLTEDVTSCIRINADKFIFTGYNYLEKLLLYKIPNYQLPK